MAGPSAPFIPSPVAGALDYLPQYIISVRQLLHDASAQYYSDDQLAVFINEARRRVCLDTGCLRKLISADFPANVEKFNFGGIYAVNNSVSDSNGPLIEMTTGYTNAAASCNTTNVPLVVTPGVPAGQFYVEPAVTLLATDYDPTTQSTISAQAVVKPVLGAIAGSFPPYEITGYTTLYDNGQYSVNGVTPQVIITPQGISAFAESLGPDGSGGTLWQVLEQGHGFSDGLGFFYNTDGATFFQGGGSILDKNIASVNAVTLIWNNQRIALRNMAFTDFSIEFRSWVNYVNYPLAYSVFNDAIYIGPVPNQTYSYELDCLMYPEALAFILPI